MLFGYRCDIMNGKGMTLGMITAAERRHTGIDYIVSPVFEALGIPHMFTTRYGGVSEGCFESLNFTVGRGKVRDDHFAVLANAALAAGVFRMLPDQVVWPRQEHTAVAARIDEKNPSAPEHGCDALVTSQRGKLLAVVTADCVPVLLYDTRADVCAAVHSGWRGTLDGVAGAALELMVSGYGCRAADIVAAIGPCIRGCCYEVGEEIYKHFTQRDTAFTSCFERFDGSLRFSLASAVAVSLRRCGVGDDAISDCGLCTCCDGEFFSHRRSGLERGSIGSFISVRPDRRGAL